MSNKPLSRTAMLAKGALLAHLMPRLAADAKFDLNPILAGVTAANWLTRKASIVDAIKPKLAADADLGAIHKLMDSLDDEKPAEDTDDPAAEPAADPAADPKADPMDANVIGDADPIAEVMEMLQGKLSDEDLAAVKAKLDGMKMSGDDDGDGDEDESLLDKIRALVAGDKPAQDSPPKVDPVDPPIVQDADTDDKDDKEKPFTKAAMDSAIGRAVKDAEAKTVARMRAAAEAEEAVKPYVGKLATAFDSAESVYKAALETLGVGTAKLHPSAYRAVLEAQPKPAGGVRRMASDEAANADSVATQFPGLAATRVI